MWRKIENPQLWVQAGIFAIIAEALTPMASGFCVDVVCRILPCLVPPVSVITRCFPAYMRIA